MWRAIKNGVLYDTEAADYLAPHKGHRQGAGVEGIWEVRESLYRSKGGAWFFLVESWEHPERDPEIELLDDDKAYNWLCLRREVDLVNRDFPNRLSQA